MTHAVFRLIISVCYRVDISWLYLSDKLIPVADFVEENSAESRLPF